MIDSTMQASDVENFTCSVPLLSPLVNNLLLRCSSGADHLPAHHLCYADPSINIKLSRPILLNLCLFRGVIPDNCLASVVIPIVKDKNKDLQYVIDYYRIIAVASTISKLPECFILHRINSFL